MLIFDSQNFTVIIRRIFLFLENNTEIFGGGCMKSVIHSQKEQKKLYEKCMHIDIWRGRERENMKKC